MGSVRLFLKRLKQENECQGLMVALYERQLLHVNLLALFHTVNYLCKSFNVKRAQTVDKSKLLEKWNASVENLCYRLSYGKYMKKLTMSSVIFGTDKISFPRKKVQ